MECPKCGYIMDAFTVDCPRCLRNKLKNIKQTPTPVIAYAPQRDTHSNPADRQKSIAWVTALFANRESAVILDTETTGLDEEDEIIQIGVIDLDGNVLIDSFVRPEQREEILEEATEIHGITMDMLAGAPTFRELLPVLSAITHGKTIVAYNAEFDARLLDQTCAINGTTPMIRRWDCAMLEYARFVGEIHPYFQNYRWHKLPNASHGAIGDCKAIHALLMSMNALGTLYREPAAVAPQPEIPPVVQANPLMKTVNPVWFLLFFSILLPIVGFILGIVYLTKSTQEERMAGLVSVVVSSIVMTWFLSRLG